MKSLWYGSDEVREFHPIVEESLNAALIKSNLQDKYIIEHHYGQYTSGIPDFALLDKQTGDFVCIIEIKKTPSDVFSFSAGNQTKGYVDELKTLRWKPDFFPHFCVTNIEITQFYCWREDSSLIGCLLTGSPHDCGLLREEQECYEKFTLLFSEYFKMIDILKAPEFSRHLEAISESFNQTLYSVAMILGVNLVRMTRLVEADEQIRESILYELLRFAFYYFIKESYDSLSSPFSENFPDFDINGLSDLELLSVIEYNFSKAMEIDFKDILEDYDSESAIIPKGLKEDKELRNVFNNFIQTLCNNANQGIKNNSNLLNFVSLLTSEIYNKEEMHASGKIMSDEMLSDILAEFAIDSEKDTVIDPCCGDGNLLMSAYKRLKVLSPESTHNDLLKLLTGFEIDVNLLQLAAFKLICSNLNQVNRDTSTVLKHVDLFNIYETNEYDALVMNPPFLRNEDLDATMKFRYIKNLEKVSEKKSFIRDVSQPNLYFFFVEKALSLLKESGKASVILMTKLLNNEDGKHLKEMLLPYMTAVIAYPPDFFAGFAVTTCIVLLSKEKNPNTPVSFFNVKDTNILATLDTVKENIKKKCDVINDKYSVINILPKDLNPSENWRWYLIDPERKFEHFEGLDFLTPLTTYFATTQRGKAENCGGSSVIYPYSSNNLLSEDVEKIEARFIGFGMQRNKVSGGRRKIILTQDCLNFQKGLIFPSSYDTSSPDGIPKSLKEIDGLREYCTQFSELNIKGKLVDVQRIMNSAYGSAVTARIIIPRADRKKHIVYFNPFAEKILMSTNFFYCESPQNMNPQFDELKQIQFLVAFLNSSFGQIEFEMHGNNQEGMRKIEGFIIERLRVPDLKCLEETEIEQVVDAFQRLNESDEDFLGIEDENPRRELDTAIGEIIFSRNKLGFGDVGALVNHFENFLSEIVLGRIGGEG